MPSGKADVTAPFRRVHKGSSRSLLLEYRRQKQMTLALQVKPISPPFPPHPTSSSSHPYSPDEYKQPKAPEPGKSSKLLQLHKSTKDSTRPHRQCGSQRYPCRKYSVNYLAIKLSVSFAQGIRTAMSVAGKNTRPRTAMVFIALPSRSVERAMSFESRAVERFILLSL